MQVASTSFRAYGLDLWGFGESARDPMRYTIDQQTDMLSRFLAEMGIGKVALVGHGLGALVGFNFCSRWTQSVDRMMAVNAPMFYDSINERLRTSSFSFAASLSAAIAFRSASGRMRPRSSEAIARTLRRPRPRRAASLAME